MSESLLTESVDTCFLTGIPLIHSLSDDVDVLRRMGRDVSQVKSLQRVFETAIVYEGDESVSLIRVQRS